MRNSSNKIKNSFPLLQSLPIICRSFGIPLIFIIVYLQILRHRFVAMFNVKLWRSKAPAWLCFKARVQAIAGGRARSVTSLISCHNQRNVRLILQWRFTHFHDIKEWHIFSVGWFKWAPYERNSNNVDFFRAGIIASLSMCFF